MTIESPLSIKRTNEEVVFIILIVTVQPVLLTPEVRQVDVKVAVVIYVSKRDALCSPGVGHPLIDCILGKKSAPVVDV